MFGVFTPFFHVKRYSFWSVMADEVQFGFETPHFLKIGHLQRVPQPRTNIEQNPNKTRRKQQP